MISLYGGGWYLNDLQSTPSPRDIKTLSATDLDVVIGIKAEFVFTKTVRLFNFLPEDCGFCVSLSQIFLHGILHPRVKRQVRVFRKTRK